MKVCSRLYVACFRWLALVAVLVFSAWACVSHPLTQPIPDPGQISQGKVTVAPVRKLDLLFMVDNSPSMAPKQEKMAEQFPSLIDGLRDTADHTLPDLRVAIIDSDLGSGLSGRCTKSARYGDMGKFQMRDAATCGANADARWLEYTKGSPINFDGELKKVFKCLAVNVGVEGCGFEHQLAAIEWAFYLPDNKSQKEFLRPEAYLGIVILTDEDDCSATPNTAMFNSANAGESGSLRCATRGHVCDGTTLVSPTTGAVSVPYESCRARTGTTCDDAKDDASGTTACNPLVDVAQLAKEVKELKGDAANDKILVAGIYGTPRKDDTSAKKYVIDKAADLSNPAGPQIFDYWPICYDPAYLPSGSGFDLTAAEHGATGGLRISSFLKEFNTENSLSYSICESNFGPAMEGIGNRLRNMMNDLCVPFKLVDTSDDPGIQADCRVAYSRPSGFDDKGNQIFKEDKDGIPSCNASRTSGCWELKLGDANGTADQQETARRCPVQGSAPSQMINIVRAPGETLDDGTRAVMYCLSCVDALPGLRPKKGCDY
jgi:hypothetical protein